MTPESLLKKHSFRKTGGRIAVIEAFQRKGHALSHHDLEQSLNGLTDRVTIYRTLNQFEEKGLIHRVPTQEGIQRFALCQDACSEHEHMDQHVHFNCVKCKQTVCLDEVQVPSIALPPGYELKEMEMSASGICDRCSQH